MGKAYKGGQTVKKYSTIQAFAAKSLRAAGIEEFSVRIVDLPYGWGCGWLGTRNLLLIAQNLPVAQVRTDILALCNMLAPTPPELV